MRITLVIRSSRASSPAPARQIPYVKVGRPGSNAGCKSGQSRGNLKRIMPELGEQQRAQKLGFKGHALHTYEACPECGQKRWVRVKCRGMHCKKCADKIRNISLRLGTTDSKLASEIGTNAKRDYRRYRDYCPDCGSEIWRRYSYIGKRCPSCAAKLRPRREQTQPSRQRRLRYDGYIEVKINRDDPLFCMVADKKKGTILEHRLVMAQYLNRPLEKWEVVHHKNGIKDDNRIENLELFPLQSSHLAHGRLTRRVRRLEIQVGELRNENKDLRKELNLIKWHIRQGNPELSSDSIDAIVGMRRDYTAAILSNEDDEIVHSPSKDGGKE